MTHTNYDCVFEDMAKACYIGPMALLAWKYLQLDGNPPLNAELHSLFKRKFTHHIKLRRVRKT